MTVTLLPIFTFVSELQYLNAEPPMDVTLFGMVTLLSDVHPSNAK